VLKKWRISALETADFESSSGQPSFAGATDVERQECRQAFETGKLSQRVFLIAGMLFP
jgi:hypothetical protein